MTLHKVLAGAAATLTLTSGCGGSGSHNTSTASSAKPMSSTGASMLALAKCVRQHGVPNFPDPTRAPDGTWQFPPTGENQKLPDACAALKKGLGGQSAGPKPPAAADISRLRQFAQCMRQHGLSDWPDPQANGSFALPPRISQGRKSVMKTQMDACRKYLPSGGFTTTDESNG